MVDKSVVGWRAWYTEERRFSSADTDWTELPVDGVLVIVVYYDDGDRKHFDHREWYFHEPGTDFFAATDRLEQAYVRYPDVDFKRGKWTDQETFESARQEAWDSEPP